MVAQIIYLIGIAGYLMIRACNSGGVSCVIDLLHHTAYPDLAALNGIRAGQKAVAYKG